MLCILLFLTYICANLGDELILVQLVWRHGDRSPLGNYKNDPYKESDWPVAWGELLTTGMKQHYLQGIKLRQRYMIDYQFLNKSYWADDIYVQSDDMNRCLQSAMANMAGFYAESKDTYPSFAEWPSFWTPVPIHTVDHDSDHLFNFGICPRSYVLEAERILKKGFIDFLISEIPFLMNVSKNAGFNFLEIQDYIKLFDCIITEHFNNYTLPSWVTDDVYAKGVKLASQVEDYVFGSALFNETEDTENIMLRGGPLLAEIISNMNNSINGEQEHKYYAYSGHDTTLSAILRNLGAKFAVLGNTQPNFAAVLVFELWKMENGSYQVQVAYSADAETPYRVITQHVSGCPMNNLCEFDTFVDRSLPYMPKNIELQCLNLLG